MGLITKLPDAKFKNKTTLFFLRDQLTVHITQGKNLTFWTKVFFSSPPRVSILPLLFPLFTRQRTSIPSTPPCPLPLAHVFFLFLTWDICYDVNFRYTMQGSDICIQCEMIHTTSPVPICPHANFPSYFLLYSLCCSLWAHGLICCLIGALSSLIPLTYVIHPLPPLRQPLIYSPYLWLFPFWCLAFWIANTGEIRQYLSFSNVSLSIRPLDPSTLLQKSRFHNVAVYKLNTQEPDVFPYTKNELLISER